MMTKGSAQGKNIGGVPCKALNYTLSKEPNTMTIFTPNHNLPDMV